VVQRGKGIEQSVTWGWRVIGHWTTLLSTVRRISADFVRTKATTFL
jgi:hypothetical protein